MSETDRPDTKPVAGAVISQPLEIRTRNGNGLMIGTLDVGNAERLPGQVGGRL